MPWNEVTVNEQRQNFIRGYRLGYYTISDLTKSFGISRKTAYKWIRRWEEHGDGGLIDHSRRPRSSLVQTPENIRDELLAVRKKRPHWGPKDVILTDTRFATTTAMSTSLSVCACPWWKVRRV